MTGWQELVRLLGLIETGRRRQIFILAGGMLLATVLEVVGIASVFPFIALVNDPGAIERLPVLKNVQAALGQGNATFVSMLGVALVAVVVIKNILAYYLARFQTWFAFEQSTSLAGRLLERYQSIAFVDHLRRSSASTITTINHHVDLIFLAVLLGILTVTTELAAALGVLAVLLVAEPVVTLAVGATLVVTVLLIQRVVRKRTVVLGAENLRLNEARLRDLQQLVEAFKEIRLLGRQRYFSRRFLEHKIEHGAVHLGLISVQAIPRLALEAILVLALVSVVLFVLWRYPGRSDIAALLGMFAVAAFRLLPTVNRVLVGLSNIHHAWPALREVDAALNWSVEEAGTASEPVAFTKSLLLDDVTFRYPGAEAPALERITLEVKCGESVGLVGSSGAGKSTLVDLLLGLLRPQSGRIVVDGRDVAPILAAWQERVGYMPQTITLLDDSVRRNIAFGLPDSEIDDERVARAVRTARLDEVIARLPEGLNTLVGERGLRLSGGQRQRLGLARTLYKDFDLLVLDEATSALDAETEREIAEEIDSLKGRKTLLVIAHRLATVRHCDRIALMKDGSIADIGPFEELRVRNADFRRMVELAELAETEAGT